MVAARSFLQKPTKMVIRDWLVDGISLRAGIDPASIDVAAPASGMLDSLDAVDLAGEAADFLGIEVSPALLWEAPSIAQLAADLAVRARHARRVAPQPARRTQLDSAPLTAAQECQYERALLAGAGAESNCVAALRCTGLLDPRALQAALDCVVRKHEALRTCFERVEGRARQRIVADAATSLRSFDLRPLPEDLRETTAMQMAHEEAATAIDPGRPPLLRATLIRLAEREHVLVLVVHHLVFD